jgi:hypothetical protein
VEQAVLPTAATRTPSRVRELVDREVARIDPDAAARREQAARRCRGVRGERGQNGMGTLRADVSAPDAEVTFQVLDRIAAAVQAAGLAAGRGRSQIRADVFTDLFKDLAATGQANFDAAGAPGDIGSSHAGSGANNRPDDGADGTDAGADTTADRAFADGASSVAADTSPIDSDFPDTADTGCTDTGCTDTDSAHARPAAVAGEDNAATDRTAASMMQAAADRASGRRAGARWAVPVCVNVYVLASTLAGWDDEPAELAGHGVISADLARALAQSAETIRAIAVHPPPSAGPPDAAPPGPERPEWTATGHSADPIRSRWCGSVLDAGRTARSAPKATADHVVTRDRICTFTGCRARAEKCDLDHRLPWDRGGATCPCNQDPLCRFHHLIKTFTPWRAVPGPDGALVWTSPIGRHYGTEPGHPLFDGNAPVDGHPTPHRGQAGDGVPARDPHPVVNDTADDPPPF